MRVRDNGKSENQLDENAWKEFDVPFWRNFIQQVNARNCEETHARGYSLSPTSTPRPYPRLRRFVTSQRLAQQESEVIAARVQRNAQVALLALRNLATGSPEAPDALSTRESDNATKRRVP